MEFEIPIDLKLEKEFLVDKNHLAAHLGSSSISVLSTPSMILFMEIVSRICAEQVLPKEYNTVGTKLTIEHLAAAPLGAKIKAKTKIKEYKSRKILFQMEAWWKGTKIGQGTHERFIIHEKRFLEKLKEKLNIDD